MTVVAAPGASVVSPGRLTENDDASAPAITNGDVSVTGAGVLFVSVTVAVAVRPTARVPKLTGQRRRADSGRDRAREVLRIARRQT